MTLQHVLQRDVDTALPSESTQTAAQRMSNRNVGMLVVVDDKAHPIGILTDRDLAISVVAAGKNPHYTLVREVMTAEPSCIPEDKSSDDALEVMRARGVRRLPVVNARGLLVGVISMDDVLHTLSVDLTTIAEVLDNSSPRRLALQGETTTVPPRKATAAKPAKKGRARRSSVKN